MRKWRVLESAGLKGTEKFVLLKGGDEQVILMLGNIIKYCKEGG